MVGATELTASRMAGAPAAIISSMKMYCSTADFPRPPNSFGQPIAHQAFSNIWRWKARASGPSPSLPAWRISATSAGVTAFCKKRRTSSRHASCSRE